MVGGACKTTFSATLCTSRLTASAVKSSVGQLHSSADQALDGAIDASLLVVKVMRRGLRAGAAQRIGVWRRDGKERQKKHLPRT